MYVECLACLDYLESLLLLIRYEDTQGDQDEQHTQGVQDDQHTQDDQWGWALFKVSKASISNIQGVHTLSASRRSLRPGTRGIAE